MKMGFLYLGYKPRLYFWEFIIMYRKIITLAITMLPDSQKLAKSVLVLLIITASLAFHVNERPFIVNKLNEIEYSAILVSTVTIYVGLFYLDDSFGNEMKAFFFITIVFTNIKFFLIWFYYVIQILAIKYRANPKIIAFLKKLNVFITYLKGYLKKLKKKFKKNSLANLNKNIEVKRKNMAKSISFNRYPLRYNFTNEIDKGINHY